MIDSIPDFYLNIFLGQFIRPLIYKITIPNIIRITGKISICDYRK